MTGPGIHGPAITGIHGAGVGTPRAAAVAAATAGLLCVIHTPKGGIFINGAISIILPAGVVDITVLITLSTDGAAPKEHIHITPVPMCIIIVNPLLQTSLLIFIQQVFKLSAAPSEHYHL